MDFDSGIEFDPSGIYGEEDPYFLYDNTNLAGPPKHGNASLMQLHPTMASQLGAEYPVSTAPVMYHPQQHHHQPFEYQQTTHMYHQTTTAMYVGGEQQVNYSP